VPERRPAHRVRALRGRGAQLLGALTHPGRARFDHSRPRRCSQREAARRARPQREGRRTVKGDLLSQATRALRENVDGASDSARATGDRVVSLRPRKRRLRLVRPWGFSMAALLIGSSVWAMGGAPIKSWLGRLADSSEQLEAAPPAAAPAKKRVRNRSSAPQPALATTPPPSTDDEPLVESPEAPPSAGPPPEPATAPRKAPPTGPP